MYMAFRATFLTRDNRALEALVSTQRAKIGANNADNDGDAFNELQRDANALQCAHFQTGGMQIRMG